MPDASWILFDYGNVISEDQSAEDKAALAKVADVDEETFWRAYWDLRPGYDTGEVGAHDYWAQVGGPEANASRLRRIDVGTWMHFRPEMLDLLDELSRHHRLALLSNAPWDMVGAILASPLAGYFEYLTFSCELSTAKPNAACFEGALQRMNADPGEVIFIDDRRENIRGAEALGIRGILFTGAADLRAELGG